jgi:hypothetical protein
LPQFVIDSQLANQAAKSCSKPARHESTAQCEY